MLRGPAPAVAHLGRVVSSFSSYSQNGVQSDPAIGSVGAVAGSHCALDRASRHSQMRPMKIMAIQQPVQLRPLGLFRSN